MQNANGNWFDAPVWTSIRIPLSCIPQALFAF